MPNIKLNPISNPNLQNKTVQEQWIDKVNESLKKSQIPYNNPVSVRQNLLNIEGDVIPKDGTGQNHLEILQDTTGDGFYQLNTGVIPKTNTTRSGQRLRLSKVNEIVLSYDCHLVVEDISGFVPVVASSSYSVRLPISIAVTNQDDTFSLAAPFGYEKIWTVQDIELSYDLPSDTWTVVNPHKDYLLADYIDTRPSGGSGLEPDFTVNYGQVTKAQYESLVNNNNTLIVYFGANYDDYIGLSTANQNHFDDYFNTKVTSGVVIVEPRLSVSLTYYGLTANYKPVNN